MTSPMGERQMFPVQTKETVKGDMAAFSPAPPGKATDLGPGAPQAPVPTTASPARPGRADPGTAGRPSVGPAPDERGRTMTSCTPVVVDGWGGAGEGCVSVGDAQRVLAVVVDHLRGAFPEQWQSSAADEFTARLEDLLLHADRLGELLATARERAAEMSAAVARAWEDR